MSHGGRFSSYPPAGPYGDTTTSELGLHNARLRWVRVTREQVERPTGPPVKEKGLLVHRRRLPPSGHTGDVDH
jgi:hypothetical protein